VVGNAGEYVCEPGLRVDVVEAGGLDERGEALPEAGIAWRLVTREAERAGARGRVADGCRKVMADQAAGAAV